ncbi:MAG: hypothetical protein ACFFD4_28875 [Candidatus Odinarchaeota archaeon]
MVILLISTLPLLILWTRNTREYPAAKLDELGWLPSSDADKVLYFLATEQWHILISIGEPSTTNRTVKLDQSSRCPLDSKRKQSSRVNEQSRREDQMGN